MSPNRAEYQVASSSEPENEGDSAQSTPGKQTHGLGIKNPFVTSPSGRIKRRPMTTEAPLPEAILSSDNNSPELGRERRTGRGVYFDINTPPNNLESHDSPSFQSSPDRRLLSPGQQHQKSGDPPQLHFDCQTEHSLIEGRWTWLSISVLVLAIYSTVFSAIYLGIALSKPRYGTSIGTEGKMSAATAGILSTTIAKTVELSYVTVFVAFLGQVLSRRAIRGQARGGGVSIAEMMMRQWIMQPGTLITHGEAVKYAALTFLGVSALTATFVAMFYVTAAEALVSPKLLLGGFEDRTLSGKVMAGFANSTYLGQTCPTPITLEEDELYRGTTCLQIEHASAAYYNYQLFLNTWTKDKIKPEFSKNNYTERPPPVGVLAGNITVLGQWITPSAENITKDSSDRKWLIQNVTMAMPHENVMNAAKDPRNNILQPQRLKQAQGQYIVSASVPAPAVNVLCVGVTEDEISPLIYTKWPTNNGSFNSSTWPRVDDMIPSGQFPNATAIDTFFDFGEEAGDRRQTAPIFPKLPLPYNTLVNGTGAWPMHSIYLLVGTPAGLKTNPYLFCSLRATQYFGCTTRYWSATAGGKLEVHCDDDPLNTLPYEKSQPESAKAKMWSPEWKNVASEWANSLSLGVGLTDGNASNARLLSQMIPEYDDKTHEAYLNPKRPSIAEALSVLAGCTLMLSTSDSPFVHFWKYAAGQDLVKNPVYEDFNASVAFSDYASGSTEPWQSIFFVVLVIVFVTNVICLAYLLYTIRGEGQVTDYTEPQNLFALAVNSPPSRNLRGACGAGPEGRMLAQKWEVDMQKPPDNVPGHPHFYVRCGDEPDEVMREPRKRKSRMSLRSLTDVEAVASPAVEQYEMISKGKKAMS